MQICLYGLQLSLDPVIVQAFLGKLGHFIDPNDLVLLIPAQREFLLLCGLFSSLISLIFSLFLTRSGRASFSGIFAGLLFLWLLLPGLLGGFFLDIGVGLVAFANVRFTVIGSKEIVKIVVFHVYVLLYPALVGCIFTALVGR